MNILITYGIAAVLLFATDMVWLGLVMKNQYKEKLGYLMADKIVWPAALIFYLLYVGGIIYFAVDPALRSGSWQDALLKGAMLGGLCYATYDLTNLATIDKWPVSIVVLDIAWGILLTGGVSVATYFIGVRFLNY